MTQPKMTFAQGLQLFFIERILRERYGRSEDATSKRGRAFFADWSRIVRQGRKKDANFPLTVKVPKDFGKPVTREKQDSGNGIADYAEDRSSGRRITTAGLGFAPQEYHAILVDPKFFNSLELLADDDLADLMQIAYPVEAAEKVAAIRGKGKDADIVREAVARDLNKKPDELTADDYAKVPEVDLSEREISDISELAALTKLQWLNLSDTQVADISTLAALTELQWLDLSNTQAADISPLAALTNLQQLYLSNTQVADISTLAALTNLKRLILSDTQVADISPLAALTNLQVLDLSNTQVSDEQVKQLQKALPEITIRR